MNQDAFHKLLLNRNLITKQRDRECYGTSMVRTAFPEFLKSIGCRTGAEIGVHTGAYTAIFAQHLTGTFYAIDPWMCWPEHVCSGGAYREKYHPGAIEKTEQSRLKALSRIEKYNHVKVVRQTSLEASIGIPDDSLDMVYVDGNHLYPYVWIDLWNYWPKLREGGIMSGHDLNFSSVTKAVQEFVAKANVPYWYVMENEHPTSFFWIKGY